MSDAADKKAGALVIVKTLRSAGFSALFVGGAVRDMIMGNEPKDYDIATNASLHDIERLFDSVYPVGSRFGVSLVVIGDHSFEVACFRKDGIYEDGRRPSSVEPGCETDDAERRDFTINALFFDPLENRIIDHIGGIQDIHNRTIRAVGDPRIRFREDRLRMLRAVRFAARFQFSVDDETMRAIKENTAGIHDVSAERIGEELVKIFGGPHPGYALTLLDETGLLREVLPEVSALRGVEQPAEFHPEGDVFEHTRRMLELYEGGSSALAFGVLFHDIAKPVTMTKTDRIRYNRHDELGAVMAGKILRRLRISNEMTARVQGLVRNHMRFMHVRNMKPAKLLRFMQEDGFTEMLELYRLDCLASHGNLEDYDFLVQTFRQEKPEDRNPSPPLLDGNDLLALGYEEGPLIGVILRKVDEHHLEGELNTREDANNFVRRLFPQPSHRQNRKRKKSPPD
ncbi:CCA tRNA nucleotidyltransferase [bacterium]|nr:CCA tRNA nucleotidyltransferase [bacterium]